MREEDGDDDAVEPPEADIDADYDDNVDAG
jgi:hypothetical protein